MQEEILVEDSEYFLKERLSNKTIDRGSGSCTYKHVVHATIPTVSIRHVIYAAVDSIMTSVFFFVTVQHDIISGRRPVKKRFKKIKKQIQQQPRSALFDNTLHMPYVSIIYSI